jgi:hypothetical protein
MDSTIGPDPRDIPGVFFWNPPREAVGNANPRPSIYTFKPMLILNIKNGFDIVEVYSDKFGETKIVLEKSLDILPK